MTGADGLGGELTYGPAKAGKVEVGYALGGTTHVRQRVDPASPASRRAFLAELRKVLPSIDDTAAEDFDRQLMAVDVTSPAETTDTGGQGRPLELRTDEPWSEPVDGAAMLDELVVVARRYVVLPYGGAEALALWVAHTYLFECADCTPRLGVTSPEKGCGKSTVLDLLGALVHRPLSMSNVTTAAVFRSIELARPTLVVDEADSFLIGRNADDELRGVLNSGHARTGAVVRCVGEDAEPRQFSTFSPCAIALIGDLPATLQDRSILLQMRRRAPGENVARMRRSKLAQQLEPLRQRILRWASDHRDQLQDADPDLSALDALSDRARDNWRLCLAIADAAGGEWPAEARAVAAQLATGTVEETSAGVLLLGDLRDLFAARGVEKIPSEEVVRHLVALEDRPWAEWRRGQPMNARSVATLLKPYAIRPVVIRTPAGTPRGYRREDLADAWERYLPAAPPLGAQQRNNRPAGPIPGQSDPQQASGPVADGIARGSASHAESCGVADREGGPAGERIVGGNPASVGGPT